MNPARKPDLTEPLAGDEIAELRRIFLDEIARMRADHAAERADRAAELADAAIMIKNLQADLWRLVASGGHLTELIETADNAPRDVIAALPPDDPWWRKAIELVRAQAAEMNARRKASPEWGKQQFVAFRIGCTVQRVAQLRESGTLEWKHDDNSPILLKIRSVDAWLESQGRAPRFPTPALLHPHQLRQKLMLGE
jgi:hypothetical protein